MMMIVIIIIIRFLPSLPSPRIDWEADLIRMHWVQSFGFILSQNPNFALKALV